MFAKDKCLAILLLCLLSPLKTYGCLIPTQLHLKNYEKLKQAAECLIKKKQYSQAIKLYGRFIQQTDDTQLLRIKKLEAAKNYVDNRQKKIKLPPTPVWSSLKKLSILYKLMSYRALQQKKTKVFKIFKRREKVFAFLHKRFLIAMAKAPKLKTANTQKNTILLTPKHLIPRADFSYSQASSLWVGSNKRDFTGNDLWGETNKIAKRQYYTWGLNASYGLLKNYQLDFRISTVTGKIKNASFLGAVQGESVSQINQLSLGLQRSLWQRPQHEIITSLSYTYPGKLAPTKPVFLSSNDFSQYLDFGAKYSYQWQWLNPQTLLRFRVPTSGEMHSRLLLDTQLMLSYFDWIHFGPLLNFVHTFSGFDILDSEFVSRSSQSQIFPLHQKKERLFGLGLTAVIFMRGGKYIDLTLHKVLDGRNTGSELSFTAGFSIKIW